MDTSHPADEDGIKRTYNIDAVEEETQLEIVCADKKISQRHLIPVMERLLEQFPFGILSFHVDNCS